MPASCASLPAPMKRSVCSPDLTVIKDDDMEEGILEKESKRRASLKDPKSKPAKKIEPQIQNKPSNAAAENALKVDERLRLARERREQKQRELATREEGWLAREARAQRHYEKHLEERRRRLEETRKREERRRQAVEEKRRQRLNEDRVRYEEVLKRTMERSQKAKQRQLQLARRAKLSASKAPRSRPLTEWEKDLVRRLQTPTISHLARSRSVGAAETDAVSCQQVRSSSCSSRKVEPTTAPCSSPQKKPVVRPPHPRPLPLRPQLKTSQVEQKAQKPAIPVQNKKRPQKKPKKTEIQFVPATVKTTSPSSPSQPPDPPPERAVIRAVTRRPAPQLEGLLPPLLEEESDSTPYCDTPPLSEEDAVGMTVNNDPQHEQMEEGNLDTPPPPLPPPSCQNSCPAPVDGDTKRDHSPPAAVSSSSSSSSSKSPAGTMDPEEATRMLAEKRRQARQQRDERRREEFERQAQETLARLQAEENARLEADTQQRLDEERKKEELEQKQMEEEKRREEEQKQIEEERLKRQKEEEEARQKEELKKQREQHFQKEEEERQERKKRLEEIMKRTRKAESAERKSAPASVAVTEAPPKENTEPMGNHREDVILLSGPNQTKKLDLDPREDVVPSVTFKERRSLRTLTGLDHIQTQQRAEVI